MVAEVKSLRRLIDRMEIFVSHFGPDDQDMIQAFPGEDQGNAECMAELASALCCQGDHAGAHRILHYQCGIYRHAQSQVIDMHRHITAIAEVLLQLPDFLVDSAATRAALSMIVDAAHKAYTCVELHKEAFASFIDELWHIQQNSMGTQCEADEEVQQYARYRVFAALQTMITAVVGVGTAGIAGIGILANIHGASWAHSIPFAGQVLRTTAKCVVRAVATALQTFDPASAAVPLSLGAAVGLFTACGRLQATGDMHGRNLAREKRDRAMEQAAWCEEVVRRAEHLDHMINAKITRAELYASVWWGIVVSARDAIHSFKPPHDTQLNALDPRVKLLAKHILNVVTAVPCKALRA